MYRFFLLPIFVFSYVCNVHAQQPLSTVNISPSASNTQSSHYHATSQKQLAPRAIEVTERKITVDNFISNINDYLNITAGLSFSEKESNTDHIGMSHHFLKQYYKGIPVEGLGYRVHERNGFVTSANGKAMREISVDITSKLSEEQAFALAIEYLQTTDTTKRRGKKLIVSKNFTYQPLSFSVAYQFDIDVSLIERWRISIDAQNGKVINKENLVKSCFHSAPASYDTGIGLTKYYGTKTIRVNKSDNGSARLEGQTEHGGIIGTYDFRNVSSLTLFFNDYKVYQFYSSDNNFNTIYQQPAVSVQWAAEQAYEYYFIKHNRNSFDGNGTAITSYVHVDKDWDNAAWTKNKLIFGDGSNNNPLVELDVVSHELTHGVMDYEADLTYSFEPGALSESFSDIMAKAVEFTTFGDSATWQLAKYFRDGGLRNMSNPKLKAQPDTYLGEMWYDGYEDQGGIHTNSGVQNYWFYLLCEGGSGLNDRNFSFSVNSIGMEAAVKIAYRNLAEYLIPTSDYLDCRIGSLLATADLFGKNSAIYQEVDKAWDAVGVTDEPIITSLDTYDITATTVRLTGNLLQRGKTVTYHFEYGITPTFGNSTSTYTYDGTIKGNINGLQSETKYYVRLVATNENGSSYDTTEFTTISLAPLVKIMRTVDVTDSSAVLHGQINPNSLPTSFYFEYGITQEMELATSIYTLSDTTDYLKVSAPVTDLQSHQTYFYKLVATNDFTSSHTDSASLFTALKPIISSFTPVTATLGTEITISGQHFNSIPENNLVSFGATKATVLSSSTNEIKVDVPKGASLGPISILDGESGLATESVKEFVPTFNGEYGKGSLQLRAAIEDISCYNFLVQDMDRDGKPDLIAAQNDRITIYQNINTGGDITMESFSHSNIPINESFYFQGLSDFDGNGFMDIIVYTQQDVRIYPNFSASGYIFFGLPLDLGIGRWRNLQLRDFDNDGHIDIAGIDTYAGDSCLFTVFRNQNPKGTLSSNSFELGYHKILPYRYIRFLKTVDLNNDGLPDVMASVLDTDFFSVFRNRSTPGVFDFEEIIISDSIRGRYTNYTVQDLNQDGWKDITSHTMFEDGKMAIFEAIGSDMIYINPTIALEGETKISVQPGDIDGDGKVDLLVGDYDGRFIFLKNNTEPGAQLSDASFELFEHYGINENSHNVYSDVILNDLNGDGRPDVINNLGYSFSPYKGNQLEIWQNSPNDCLDPSHINVSVTRNTAIINLPPNTTLDDFEIEYTKLGSTNWWQITSTTLNSLYIGATYQLRARAKCYLGFTGYHYIEFSTDCIDISSFSISDIQMNKVVLNATNLSDFEIEYSDAGKDQWISVYRYSSYISGLNKGTTYDLRYRGRCHAPADYTYTQFTTLCPGLSSLNVKNIAYNSAEVSWTSYYVGNVVLEYSDDEVNWILIEESQIMSSLLPGKQYFVRGSLACNSINSEFLYNSFITTCPSVSMLKATEITPFSAIISWADESQADSYVFKYSMDDHKEQITTITNTNSFYLEDLSPGTDYEVFVAPECAGVLDYKVTRFTTDCYVPYNLSTNAITHTTAELFWDDDYSGVPYIIEYSISGSNIWKSTESSSKKALLQGLRPGTKYEVKVHINCLNEKTHYASTGFETSLYEATTFAPNPTEHTITIYPSKDLIGNRFGIFDNTGRRVADGELIDYNLDFSSFSAGTYIIKIDEEEPLKVVKQ